MLLLVNQPWRSIGKRVYFSLLILFYFFFSQLRTDTVSAIGSQGSIEKFMMHIPIIFTFWCLQTFWDVSLKCPYPDSDKLCYGFICRVCRSFKLKKLLHELNIWVLTYIFSEEVHFETVQWYKQTLKQDVLWKVSNGNKCLKFNKKSAELLFIPFSFFFHDENKQLGTGQDSWFFQPNVSKLSKFCV